MHTHKETIYIHRCVYLFTYAYSDSQVKNLSSALRGWTITYELGFGVNHVVPTFAPNHQTRLPSYLANKNLPYGAFWSLMGASYVA